MNFVITIDVEEDDWGNYLSEGCSLDNIGEITQLQKLFDKYDVQPTYLINYPVASDKRSASMFQEYLHDGKCEIGAHCHPWNTPPLEEEVGHYNSMLCNLDGDLQHRKIECLHEVISQNLGVSPVAFRAGRWGIGNATFAALERLGYKVDTSVMAFQNWTAYHGPDFSAYGPEPFRFESDDLSCKCISGSLFQVPATVGILPRNNFICRSLERLLPTRSLKQPDLVRWLHRLKVSDRIYLSPELSDARQMIVLARWMRAQGYSCLNMFFHSTSLLPGLSPFIRTEQDKRDFMARIETFLNYILESGAKPTTLGTLESDF